MLWIFLLRLIMHSDLDVLSEAPAQCADPTGLREVESSYCLAKEILGVLESRASFL